MQANRAIWIGVFMALAACGGETEEPSNDDTTRGADTVTPANRKVSTYAIDDANDEAPTARYTREAVVDERAPTLDELTGDAGLARTFSAAVVTDAPKAEKTTACARCSEDAPQLTASAFSTAPFLSSNGCSAATGVSRSGSGIAALACGLAFLARRRRRAR